MRIRACVLILLTALPLISVAAPTIAIGPAVGPPTTALSVEGKGYATGMAVDVYFDTTEQCLVLASATGTWVCRFTVPREAQPGSHFVTAIQRSTGAGLQKPYLVRTNWTHMNGLDAARSGHNRYENTITPDNVSELGLKWKVNLGAPLVQAAPVVADGVAYVATSNGRLHAVNALTGAVIPGWPKRLGSTISSGRAQSPAYANGRVYVGADDGRVYAFTSSGNAVAGFPLPSTGAPIESSPAISANRLFVTNRDGRLYAFDATTGNSLAGACPIVLDPTGVSTTSPSVAYGRVFWSSGVGDLARLHSVTASGCGAVAGFPFTVSSGRMATTPALRYGRVYFRASRTSSGANLYAIDAFTGLTTTRFPVATISAGGSDSDDSNVAVGYGRIYLGTTPYFFGLYAFNAWNGAAVPNFSPAGGTIFGENTVLANGLVLGSYSRVFAMEASTGEQLWDQSIAVLGYAGPPVVVDGILYTAVSTVTGAEYTGGFLYAYEIPEPVRMRTIRSGHALTRPPAIASLKADANRIATASVVDLTSR